MKAIERATKHFAEQLTEVRKVQVPEWTDETGEALVIFVRPSNLAERNKIFQLAKTETLESIAQAIIIRARDEAGLPLFAPKDQAALMTAVDPDVLSRISNEINEDLGISEDDVEDATKN